nr:NB-ARC domains-containing protein [Tanacetum cinerariifolium]
MIGMMKNKQLLLLAMTASSIFHGWTYDVFVSFRGEDIRKNFMDHLFNDFKQKGIHAFRDDRELPKGEEISPHLYKAIEESRFLIVIFSQNYASSTWCLRELVKILECKQIENPKHEVQIIYYDAKPDVVRKQKRSYAQAFSKHEVSNSTEVGKWKEALSMTANLSGWDLEDMTNGYESKFIDCISKEILIKLCEGPLHVGENLVGIDINFHKLDLSRFVGSYKVNMIGVCGISGIGKTTLANAIYNLMYVHFDGSCFCEGVSKQQGIIQVQKQMIGKIMKTEDPKISSVAEGAMVIKQRISCKPVLLVLDDVDDHEHLEALAGSPTWFCPGSLIIFTDKSLITISSNKSLQMYDLIQAMAREIVLEESIMPGKQRRLLISSNVYDILGRNKVATTEAVEVLVLTLAKFSQKVHINANDFAHMKKLRILKIYQEEEEVFEQQKLELKGHNVIFSGNLNYLSNELSLFYWHGCPFKYLPSDFYPQNIVAIDLSYSNIKHFWTTPKCFRRLKVMKLRYCCNLTTTPDFSEITNLEELSLEGCVNLVSVHPSTGMLKRLVVLNLRDCKRLQKFPGRVEMDALKVLNLTGVNSVSVDPFSSGWIMGTITYTYPPYNSNKFKYMVGLLVLFSALKPFEKLTSRRKHRNKLEVLPELPPSVWNVKASDCTSLREVSGSLQDPFRNRLNVFRNCPKLFKNVTIDSEGSISKTQCLESSITSQGSIHQLSAFLGLLGFQTNRCEFFHSGSAFDFLNIVNHGNSIPEWFTNKSTGNHVRSNYRQIGASISLGDMELVLFSSAKSLANIKDTLGVQEEERCIEIDDKEINAELLVRSVASEVKALCFLTKLPSLCEEEGLGKVETAAHVLKNKDHGVRRWIYKLRGNMDRSAGRLTWIT